MKMQLTDLEGHVDIRRVTHWRNVKEFENLLHEETGAESLNRYKQIFLDDIAEQEVSNRLRIPIPPEVTAILSYRPTPLYVIGEHERCIVCVKWEGASPYGNYKLNTIAASVVAAENEGVDRIYIAGARGGNTLRTAIPEFCKRGIKVTAYWVKGTSEEEEVQRVQIEEWSKSFRDMVNVHLILSPSKREAQYEMLKEMIDCRRKGEKVKLVMACSAGHVSLHQTVIGQEISEQIEAIMAERMYNPDKTQIVSVCCGVSTNAGGTNLPLWIYYRERLDARVIQNEDCAPLSYGERATVCYDPWGVLPREEVIALRHTRIIAASGINYAETSSLVRKLYEKHIVRADTVSTLEARRTAVKFESKWGALPCLESAHALAYFPKVVAKYEQELSGDERAIIVCVVTGEERK